MVSYQRIAHLFGVSLHIMETAVFNALQRRPNDGVFYCKGQQEVDLLVREGNTIRTVIQVASEGLDRPEVAMREVGALNEAALLFPDAKQRIITSQMPALKKRGIEIVPLWRFLLE